MFAFSGKADISTEWLDDARVEDEIAGTDAR